MPQRFRFYLDSKYNLGIHLPLWPSKSYLLLVLQALRHCLTTAQACFIRLALIFQIKYDAKLMSSEAGVAVLKLQPGKFWDFSKVGHSSSKFELFFSGLTRT
jgi:hypothetical protein